MRASTFATPRAARVRATQDQRALRKAAEIIQRRRHLIESASVDTFGVQAYLRELAEAIRTDANNPQPGEHGLLP